MVNAFLLLGTFYFGKGLGYTMTETGIFLSVCLGIQLIISIYKRIKNNG